MPPGSAAGKLPRLTAGSSGPAGSSGQQLQRPAAPTAANGLPQPAARGLQQQAGSMATRPAALGG